jgi:hypothetical protein
MTPEKKKLWLYAGGATALTLLVYFIFFNKPPDKKTPPNPNPPKPPTPPKKEDLYDYPEIDNSDYQDYVNESDIIVNPSGKSTKVGAKAGTRLRKEPNTNSAIVKTYKGGEIILINKSQKFSDGIWYQLTDGSGWVRSDVTTWINNGFFG